MPKDAIEWHERVSELHWQTEVRLIMMTESRLKHPGGKLNHGMSVVNTAVIIKGTPLIDDEYLKAAVLGWGIELARPTFRLFLFAVLAL